MFRGISGRKVYLSAVGGFTAALLGLVACNGGDTDNGTASSDAGPGDSLVSDGGFGASLEIEVVDEELSVGETTGFFVRLRDPQGAPLPFIRVFCESERGIAILEPSSGGVAFESTGADGNMSGRLGGLLPGSYLLECRAQQGFNLVDRVTLRIGGSVPAEFQGFPGAAGGNLGGGSLVDQTPDVDDGGTGLRITSVTFDDAGNGSVLDLTQDLDCDDDGTNDDSEPFEFSRYTIAVTNGTANTVTLRTAQIRVQDSGADGTTSTQSGIVELAPGASGTISGNLTTTAGCAAQSFSCPDGLGETSLGICYSGTNDQVEPGTFRATAVVTGEDSNGEDFEITGNATITWDCVENCAG